MAQEFIADMGCYVISSKPDVLVCLALGSCVGVALYDPDRGIGGFVHVMLPSSQGVDLTKTNNPNKFADIGIMNMVKELKAKGCNIARMKAKIAGGAHMFKNIAKDMEDIGKRNAENSKIILKNLNIPLVFEEIGGGIGRTVRLYLEDGSFEIKTKDGIKKN